MNSTFPEVFLVRHGETAWTVTGRFTGKVDLPLTPHGETEAAQLGERLRGIGFGRVFSSPRARALRTCELAGFRARAEIDEDLVEWDYGRYEGRRLEEVRAERQGWSLYRDGCPDGESVEAITTRADRVVTRLRGIGGRAALFGHGHFFRALAARWLGEPVALGAHLLFSPAAVGVLGYEHGLETPALARWNDATASKP